MNSINKRLERIERRQYERMIRRSTQSCKSKSNSFLENRLTEIKNLYTYKFGRSYQVGVEE